MNVFAERMDLYFLVNAVEPERRHALLLQSISDEVYKKLRDICVPASVKDKTYEELIVCLKEHFGNRAAYRERQRFYRAEQMENETATEWLKRIEIMAKTCDFTYDNDAIMRDRFISGLRSESTIDRLCDEQNPNMPLERALEICVELTKSNLD